jgi:hypothetical protein
MGKEGGERGISEGKESSKGLKDCFLVAAGVLST